MHRAIERVCVVTGTRAEFGLFRPVLDALQASPLELQLIVAGMHLSHEFGNSWQDIVECGFTIDARVDMTLSGDTGAAMAKSIGIGVTGIAQALETLDPDAVLVLGDRVEAFAGAIAAAGLNRIVGHIHGGEITQGGLDESMRHAITKLAHLHFVATEKSRERILKMGEQPERVFTVGAPGLDTALNLPPPALPELSREIGIGLKAPFLLLVQHPVTTADGDAADQMTETLEAIRSLEIPTVAFYPNADAGGRRMIDVMESFRTQPWLHVVRTVNHRVYLGLMRHAAALVGNSSSGIIEAPSFRLPVVNVGSRQEGRERSTNVIDVPHEREAIRRAVERALHDADLRACVNPYGDGRAAERIVETLRGTRITPELLQKRMTY